MTIQTTYEEKLDIGRPGHIVNTELKNLISRNVEGEEGIGFGLPVVRSDDNPNRGARATATGDTSILGVSVRECSVDANDPDFFGEGREMRVMTKGVIHVTVAVDVTAGDEVRVIVADGTWSNTGGIVVNGEYDTSAVAGGVARIRLS